MPVAVAPQPVRAVIRHVDAASDMDSVGDVIVGRVEVAAVVAVGIADRHRPRARAGGVETRTDEAAVQAEEETVARPGSRLYGAEGQLCR